MDQKNFQRQIISQTRIMNLAVALETYERNPKEATQKSVYILATGVLDNANDANTLHLMNFFLENLKIPAETLDILRYYTAIGQTISNATWEYFYNYSFTGTIETDFAVPENNILAPEARPIFQVVAESAIIDILMAPLNMLLGFIEGMSAHWKKINAIGANTYYLPKMHSDLFIFIEAHVANYYGTMHPFEVGVLNPASNVFYGYRYVGLIGHYPFNEKMIQITKDAAALQANNTKR